MNGDFFGGMVCGALAFIAIGITISWIAELRHRIRCPKCGHSWNRFKSN